MTKAEQVTGACAEHGEGGYVLATGGFRLLSPALAPVSDEIVAFDDPAIRMTDGGCDPQGRFYCGSMAYDFTPPGAGALFRLNPDLSVRRVLSGVTVSNGIHWHRGGRLVYYADTMTGRVDVYDFDPPPASSADGGYSPRSTRASVARRAGLALAKAHSPQRGRHNRATRSPTARRSVVPGQAPRRRRPLRARPRSAALPVRRRSRRSPSWSSTRLASARNRLRPAMGIDSGRHEGA